MNISHELGQKKCSRLKMSFRLTRSVALNTSPTIPVSARTGTAPVVTTNAAPADAAPADASRVRLLAAALPLFLTLLLACF
jgi:hypothetical protein